MSRLESKPARAETTCAEPHFVVGQDVRGYWVAIETHNLGGGIFKSLKDALHFADFETGHRPDAIELSTEPLTFRF